MSHTEHRDAAPDRVTCAVLTVSDTRTLETDSSGKLLRAELSNAGHEIVDYRILKDDPEKIVRALEALATQGVQVIILSGGTGISRRDGTYEAVSQLISKRLDGFGELFRYLSFHEIGAAAMMSRAQAGLYKRSIVISLPGSSGACRLALEKLILPEIGHLVREATR